MARPYGEQLAEKQRRLRDALAAFPVLGRYRLAEPSGSPEPFGYRNHAKLVFRTRRTRRGEREVLLGVYRPGTHSVLPAHGCSVHDPLLHPVLADLRREVEARGIPIFDERRRTGDLRYALARCSRLQSRVHLTLVVARDGLAWLPDVLRALRRGNPSLESAFSCENPTPGNVLLGGEVRRLFGSPSLLERVGNRVFESRPDAFLQANTAVATNLYRAAARALRSPARAKLLDVYCGVGGLGLTVARPGDRLLGIEASASAVRCARANARRAHLRSAQFVDGSAEDLTRLATQYDMEAPDVVLVNPPRKGLGSGVVRAIVRRAPAQILYVSCDPHTLARDLADFSASGYRLEHVQAFDMLPQTPHVEALAVLSRREARADRRGGLNRRRRSRSPVAR